MRPPDFSSVLWLLLLLTAEPWWARAFRRPEFDFKPVTPACQWSGLIYNPYEVTSQYYNVANTLPKSCDDPLLPANLRQQCKNCESQTSKQRCLATVAETWHNGLDAESCTWVEPNQFGDTQRTLNFTLGVNAPFTYASRLDPTICEMTRDYTITSPGYSAYFVSYGDGELQGGKPIPLGWRPETSCVIKAPATKCSLRFWNTPDLHWAISQRDIWAPDGRLVGLNSAANQACLARNGKGCRGANPPFKYQVVLTSRRCAPGRAPQPIVRYEGTFPMAQPGTPLLFPKAPINAYREKAFYLEGLSRFTWNISAPARQMLIMVAPESVILNICRATGKPVCDYSYALDTPGYLPTVCYWKRCWGEWKIKSPKDVLLITYPTWRQVDQVIPSETWPQTVTISLYGYK